MLKIQNESDQLLVAYWTRILGDPQQYLFVLHGHDAKLKMNLRAAEDKATKEANLSTSRVIKAFTLRNDDTAFVKVKSEVDKVMATSVEGVYGEFTELTTPILTQVRNK